MERSAWGRINELFEAARRLPAAEREAWVRRATADERTRAEVLSLLHAHEDDPWFVDEPSRSGATPSGLRPTPSGSRGTPSAPRPTPPASRHTPASPRATPPTPRPAPRARIAELSAGSLFASYRTVREISRGSMGVVYEAVGEGQGLRPRVTLRLLPGEWHTPALADQFFAACNLLARLDHPGIARLVDGGVADDGTPYLVMEYVAGAGIDAWCRDRDLDGHERVRLVLRVCEALEHAHQHLVVHRDLGPRNIVVTADGQPKVLNFGIARLRIEEPDTGERPTGTGQPLFTPEYASPEQVRGEPLTTATDIYSLGVLLYLLLTDYPPYEVGGLSPRQMLDTICHAEPELPSRVVPAPRRRFLSNDLDHVLLKALRKDPHARYESVTALAADLRAWLDGRPVSATPATRWYRAGKLVRRHKVAAAAVAAVVLAVAGGASAIGWQAYLTRLERDKAESRLREVLRSSRSLQLELHDSMRKLPGSTAARQLLLGRAAETMDSLAKDAGDSRALELELVEGYRSLGQLQESSASDSPDNRAAALKCYLRAVTFGEQALAAEPRSMDAAILLAGAYGDLAAARLATGERDAADRADARHRSLVEQLARDYPRDVRARVAIASGYSRLGAYRGASEDWAAAKALYGNAVAEFESLATRGVIPDDARRDYSRAQQQLGAILSQDGALDEAERLYLSAQELDRDDAARHPQDAALRHDMAGSVSALALIARRRGDVAKAESLWTEALTATQAALDADAKDTRALDGVADARASLASLCRSQRRFEEALAHYREALGAREQVAAIRGALPAAAVGLAVARTNVARVLLDLVEVRPPGPNDAGRLREAGALLTQAWPVARGGATSSPAQRDAFAEVERQTARLRRLTGERQ
jgi:non-specific serine/threonine protein kinase/serine/threonine-protein kinase